MTTSNYSSFLKKDLLLNVPPVEFLTSQQNTLAQKKIDDHKTSHENLAFSYQTNESSQFLNLFNHETNQTSPLCDCLESPTSGYEKNSDLSINENYFSTLMSTLMTESPLSTIISGGMESDSVSLEDLKPEQQSKMNNFKMANSFENDDNLSSRNITKYNDNSSELYTNTNNWLNNLNDNSCYSPDYISCNHIFSEDFNLCLESIAPESEKLIDHTYAESNTDEFQPQSTTVELLPIIRNDPVLTKAHFNFTGKITFRDIHYNQRSKSPVCNPFECIPIKELHSYNEHYSQKRNATHLNDENRLIKKQKLSKLHFDENLINNNETIFTPDIVNDVISLEQDQQFKINIEYSDSSQPPSSHNYIDSSPPPSSHNYIDSSPPPSSHNYVDSSPPPSSHNYVDSNIIGSPMSFKKEYTDNEDDNNVKPTFNYFHNNNSNDGSILAPSTPVSLPSPSTSIKYENPPSIASSFLSIEDSFTYTTSNRLSTNPPTPDSSVDGANKKRRGRPPKTISTPPDPKLLEQLEKGDREYVVQRWKNNEASRMSRLRSKTKQDKLEEQLSIENSKNIKLKTTMHTLTQQHVKLLNHLKKTIDKKKAIIV